MRFRGRINLERLIKVLNPRQRHYRITGLMDKYGGYEHTLVYPGEDWRSVRPALYLQAFQVLLLWSKVPFPLRVYPTNDGDLWRGVFLYKIL